MTARACCCWKPGGRDGNPLIHIPLGLGKMHEYGLFDWGYETEPEPNLNSRRIEAMRGKVLGGSSSINVMAYTRGNRGDYDRWAQKGARGWSYAEVLPYFKRSETWERGENTWRGGSGPLGVEFAKTRDPLFDAWIEAGKAAGFPHTDDYNGRSRKVSGAANTPSATAGAHPPPRPILRPALQADQPHGRHRCPCHARADARHARRPAWNMSVDGKTVAARCRARGDRVRRHLQHAAAADAVGHRAGRASAATWASSRSPTCRSARICRTIWR